MKMVILFVFLSGCGRERIPACQPIVAKDVDGRITALRCP